MPRATTRPSCSREDYIRASVGYLLKETPERQEELLAMLTDKDWPGWRKAFEAEMARQSRPPEPADHGSWI